MLKVVLGGMGLTGGHHPKREASSSLTSPTAPGPAFFKLSPRSLSSPLLELPVSLLPPSATCLAAFPSSSSPTDAFLATPTQPQVVPGFISRELAVSRLFLSFLFLIFFLTQELSSSRTFDIGHVYHWYTYICIYTYIRMYVSTCIVFFPNSRNIYDDEDVDLNVDVDDRIMHVISTFLIFRPRKIAKHSSGSEHS